MYRAIPVTAVNHSELPFHRTMTAGYYLSHESPENDAAVSSILKCPAQFIFYLSLITVVWYNWIVKLHHRMCLIQSTHARADVDVCIFGNSCVKLNLLKHGLASVLLSFL